MRGKDIVSHVFSILCLMIVLGLSAGIKADVGSGSFVYFNLVLFIPIMISAFASFKKDTKLHTVALILGIVLCLSLVGYMFLSKKPQYSEMADVLLNQETYFMSYVIYNIGLLFPIIEAD